MSLKIVELFGYAPEDPSVAARNARQTATCPFVQRKCIKKFRDGTVHGSCSLAPATSNPVICCPNRMYAGNYNVLLDIARSCFGEDARLIRDLGDRVGDDGDVVVFGKGWGKELRLPNRGSGGSYFVDWVLALLSPDGALREFVAVEVQTMDTTGSYEAQARQLLNGETGVGASARAGINWENVSKRILPQLIYKGNVLRREPLCMKGLFFVCPRPVYARIMTRLGNVLQDYHPQPGALTFCWYDLGPIGGEGEFRPLVSSGRKTTTIDQVTMAFTSPQNLPAVGVYQEAITHQLGV